MRVLVVEDEQQLNDLLCEFLNSQGASVEGALSASSSKLLFNEQPFDTVLVDLNLPDGSGFDLIRSIKMSDSDAGIIITSARDQLSDRIKGLDLGADDYLVKPFEFTELWARMVALNRRRHKANSDTLNIDDVAINISRREVLRSNVPVVLTAYEWSVLDALIAANGRVVERARIESALYGFGGDSESNTLEVYISRLRKKLGAEVIQTVRGIGYRFRT